MFILVYHKYYWLCVLTCKSECLIYWNASFMTFLKKLDISLTILSGKIKTLSSPEEITQIIIPYVNTGVKVCKLN